MDKIEFENGGYIIGIDLANDSKIVRSNHSKLVWINFRIKDLIPSDYKWHQKLRLKLSFVLDDIKYYLWDRWTR